MADQAVQIGRPLTAEQKSWIKRLESLTPDKSLERLDSFAKYLFGLVSTVVTLGTGLSIFAPGSLPHRGWMLIPLVLISISLALAVFGITPRAYDLFASRPENIQTHFQNLIRTRARIVLLAGFFFALAILASGVCVALASASSDVQSVIGLKLGSGANAVLSLNIAISPLPANAEAVVFVRAHATPADPASGEILYQIQDRVASDGKLALSAEVPCPDKYRYISAHCLVKAIDGQVSEVISSLNRQVPTTAPSLAPDTPK